MAYRPALLRIFDRIEFGRPEVDCWLIDGSDRRTYVQVKSGDRLVPAHRLVYESFLGPIPAGLQIDHLCRTPNCVRPDHLEAVTCETNVRRGNACGGPRPLRIGPKPPTDRQLQILSFIDRFCMARGYPPSVREIGKRFGIASTNGVHGFIRAFERKGLVSRVRGQARSLRVTEQGRACIRFGITRGKVLDVIPVTAADSKVPARIGADAERGAA